MKYIDEFNFFFLNFRFLFMMVLFCVQFYHVKFEIQTVLSNSEMFVFLCVFLYLLKNSSKNKTINSQRLNLPKIVKAN